MQKFNNSHLAFLDDVIKKHKPVVNKLNLEEICFKEQLDFINDKSPWVTASCSRRAGKTEVCAMDLLNTALNQSRINCLYLTLTRSNAERLVWPKLLLLNDTYKLGGVVNISKLSLTMPNESVIYCSGCNDRSDVDKFLGNAFKLIYLDEVQSFKSFIKDLIDRALAPTLADYAGSLKLLGTPAPLQTGYFWEAIQSDAYTHHHWTYWNNPFIAKKSGLTHEEILNRELKRRGVSKDHPSVRREWFGEWTIDTDALVLHYNKISNHYEALPILTDYVISVDVGHDDADAISVIGWHKNFKQCYLVEEVIHAQQGITELALQIEAVVKKYNPLKIVMDTGGLGKKIAEEIRKRYSIPIVAAEKTRKLEYLAILDDALRTNRFYAKRESRFAQDSFIVEWDYDKSTSDKLVIKEDPHSDIVDSVLYGFREALHWLSEPAKPKINMNIKDEWIKHTNDLMEQSLQKQIEKQQAEENYNSFWDIESMDDGSDIAKHYLNKRKSL